MSIVMRSDKMSLRRFSAIFSSVVASICLRQIANLVRCQIQIRTKYVPGKMSLSFTDTIVVPLYKDLVKILPAMSVCLENAKCNRLEWKSLMIDHIRSAGKPGPRASPQSSIAYVICPRKPFPR